MSICAYVDTNIDTPDIVVLPNDNKDTRNVNYENLTNVAVNKYDFPVVLNTNITGALCDKITEIYEIVKQNSVDVVCLTETWCNSNIPDEAMQIPGFSCFRRDRQDGRACGGVICYVKESIPVIKVWDELDNKEFETLWLTTRPRHLPRGSSNISIGVVNHPPRANDWCMSQHLVECTDTITRKYPQTEWLILGDFNHMKDQYFKRTCHLQQIVTQPTHGNSIIDLCYTTVKSMYTHVLHLPGIGLSHHQQNHFYTFCSPVR